MKAPRNSFVALGLIAVSVHASPVHAAGMYSMDSDFNSGRWRLESLADQTPLNNADYHGAKIARLANGDVIVVGRVPEFEATNPPEDRRNVGLVRYDATGNLLSWGTSSPHHFGPDNEYVIYPNTATPSYTAVVDLKVFGNRIYVLTNSHIPLFDLRIVTVLVFDLDGTLISNNVALDRTEFHQFGGGLTLYNVGGPGSATTKVIVVGNTNFPDRTSPTFVRMTLQANGSLTRDTNIGDAEGYVDLHLPDQYCLAEVQPCTAQANAVTTVASGILGQDRYIYIGGTRRHNADGKWDYLAISTSTSGVLRLGFNFDGIRPLSYDEGGDFFDTASSIQARRLSTDPIVDEVFLAGRVRRGHGTSGVGVVKFNQNGALQNQPPFVFGNGGWQVFGGCGTGPICHQQPTSLARAMVINGDRLGIVGRSEFTPICTPPDPCSPTRINPMFAAVNIADGALLSFGSFPQLASDGTSLGRNAEAWGVAAAGPDAFAVSGLGRSGMHLRWRYLTGRIAITDSIFDDRYQAPPSP